MGKYAKTVVAAVLAAAYGLQAALSDDDISDTEWWGIGVAVLIAVGVFAVPNSPQPPRP